MIESDALMRLHKFAHDALKMAVLYWRASMHVGISCGVWGYV